MIPKFWVYGTSDCPMCKYLEKILHDKGIAYTVIDNIDSITAMGYTHIPMLQYKGISMDLPKALLFLDTYKKDTGNDVA